MNEPLNLQEFIVWLEENIRALKNQNYTFQNNGKVLDLNEITDFSKIWGDAHRLATKFCSSVDVELLEKDSGMGTPGWSIIYRLTDFYQRLLEKRLEITVEPYKTLTSSPHVRPATKTEIDADLREYGRSSGTRPHTFAGPADEIRTEIKRLRLLWEICKSANITVNYVADVDGLRNLWRKKIGPPPKANTPTREAEALDVLDMLEQELGCIETLQTNVETNHTSEAAGESQLTLNSSPPTSSVDHGELEQLTAAERGHRGDGAPGHTSQETTQTGDQARTETHAGPNDSNREDTPINPQDLESASQENERTAPSDPQIPALSQRQYEILEAMCLLKAFDAEKRKSTNEIVEKAERGARLVCLQDFCHSRRHESQKYSGDYVLHGKFSN